MASFVVLNGSHYIPNDSSLKMLGNSDVRMILPAFASKMRLNP